MRRKVDFDNRLSGAVIAAAIAVDRELGPGLDEPHYQEALSRQLTRSGIGHEGQAPLPLVYKGVKLDCGYRMDFLIDGRLVVEIKSVEVVHPVHVAQLGGAVRDKYLGIRTKDVDFAVEANSYDEMKNWMIDEGFEIFVETPEFFTIRAKPPVGSAVSDGRMAQILCFAVRILLEVMVVVPIMSKLGPSMTMLGVTSPSMQWQLM